MEVKDGPTDQERDGPLGPQLVAASHRRNRNGEDDERRSTLRRVAMAAEGDGLLSQAGTIHRARSAETRPQQPPHRRLW